MIRDFTQQFKKTPVTLTVLTINLLVFGYMMLHFGTTEDAQALYLMGAKFSPAIVYDQEWWRLLTAGFLHIGLPHLIMNSLSLYYLGVDLESLLGSRRFSLIYLLAILGGNTLSFAFNAETLSAGASTGIFGLLASFVVLNYLMPGSHYLKQRASSYTLLIALNLFSVLYAPGTDHWGHFGGLVYGALATSLVVNRLQKNSKNVLIIGIIIIALSAGLIYGGLQLFN